MKVGPVIDLANYRDYVPAFARLVGSAPSCAEVHLLRRDMVEPDKGRDAILRSADFLRGQRVGMLAYHCLDDVINDVILFELFERHPRFAHMLPQADRRVREEQLRFKFECLAHASGVFGAKVMAVVHEGVYFSTAHLEALGPEGCADLRAAFLAEIGGIHRRWFTPWEDRVLVYLENSAPFRGESFDVQHFIDQWAGDMAPRISGEERLVWDVSHAGMVRTYMDSPGPLVHGLECVRRETGGRNETIELEAVAHQIGWIHLNDCTGWQGIHEGKVVGQPDSVVDWPGMARLLQRIDVPMILEIRDAEKNFDYFEQSITALRGYWDAA
jgi:hypothetical protein